MIVLNYGMNEKSKKYKHFRSEFVFEMENIVLVMKWNEDIYKQRLMQKLAVIPSYNHHKNYKKLTKYPYYCTLFFTIYKPQPCSLR